MSAPTREEEQIPEKVDFQKALRMLINQYSMENVSNTPDYILAGYLMDCLVAFDKATTVRDGHREHHD